jgi:hypothetical protein
MNSMPIKTLLQAKDERLSVSLLVTEEFIKTMLMALEKSPDQKATSGLALGEADITLEIYRPGKSTNLEYTANLARPGWEPIHVTLL